MVVTVSHTGYIKRTAVCLYRAQRRGGKGKTGMKTKEEDFVEQLFVASTQGLHAVLHRYGPGLLAEGLRDPRRRARDPRQGHRQPAQPARTARRSPPSSRSRSFDEDRNLLMATRRGVVKKSPLSDYANIRTGGIIAVNLDEGDKLIGVALTDGTPGRAARLPRTASRSASVKSGCPRPWAVLPAGCGA
ncbi:MAG: hypothetical protein M0C28_21325 [Candidatus Moduliflexus flocculans]|nr:hypothetical protein [Candidatus Moduliflexus flocculans]